MKRSLQEHLALRNHAIFLGCLASKPCRTAGEIARTITSAFCLPAVAIFFCSTVSAAAQQSTSSSTTQYEPATAPKPSGNTPTTATSDIRFDNTITTSKIAFTLRNSVSAQRYSIETMTGGIAVFDYNSDGLLDIFFTNGAEIPSLEKTNPSYYNRLFRNNGDGTFIDVTKNAGLQGIGYSMGVAAGDYNNDGLLDLFVVNYLDYDVGTAALCNMEGTPAYCSPNGFRGTSNMLYRNNGDGTFTDVSAQSHISQYVGKGMGVAFADYDNDGFTDIFVSNDTFQNYLLHNNGDGTFTDMAMETGVAFTGNGKTVAGMGADFRDLDNDGKPDIFHTAMFGDSFSLYRNLGSGQFDDATGKAGLTALTSRFTAWGTGAFDFDNDSRKDLFAATSDILDNADAVVHRPYVLPNLLLRNKDNLIFEDVSAKAGSGFSVPAAHRGAAFGDFNNDGEIDIVVTVLNGPPELLMNRTKGQNHWVILKLIGVKSNRDGLGARVKVTTTHGDQYNEATTAVGYNSSSDKRVHFGLGNDAVIDKIELAWPSGLKQTLTSVKADQVLTVTEGRQ